MFYKQNGIVAGILLLILFAGAIGLVSVQMDKTVNRMHYSVVEEMGEYRTELIRQDFQKTAELVESMQDYLATRGYQKEQFEELIALLIRQDNKVSRIWFETEGKRTICTDSGIRESEAGPSKERNGGLYAEDSTYYWTLYGRQGEVALGIDIALDHLHAYFSNLLPAGKNYAYILNDSGVIVAHPEEKWLGMRLLDSLERRRVKQVVGENKRIHVTGFSQFLLLPVDKIYYPLTVGTEKCTVVINVVQLDNQEAMADFHRYALWIGVFAVVFCVACLFPTAVAERIRFTAKGRTGSHPAEFATIEKSTQSSFFIQCFEFFECLDHYRPRSSPEIYIGNVESVSLCAGKTERKPE